MTPNPTTETKPDMEERIRERAHQLGIDEGRPEGRDQEHWDKARRLIEQEQAEAQPPGALAGPAFTDPVTAGIDPLTKPRPGPADPRGFSSVRTRRSS
jgi:hypothetical protein